MAERTPGDVFLDQFNDYRDDINSTMDETRLTCKDLDTTTRALNRYLKEAREDLLKNISHISIKILIKFLFQINIH